MFINKRKSKAKRIFLLLSIILIISFIVGYFINNVGEVKENDGLSKVNKNLVIPKNLRNVENHNDNTLYRIKETTEFCYTTHFKMCGHTIERSIAAPDFFIGLGIEDLENRIEGWKIEEVKDDCICMIKEINTFCPRHFIIGVKDNNIAIYTYNENGEKILKEKTDIDINVLTPEDQIFLTSGIVTDTEDDMEQKLEGFSN